MMVEAPPIDEDTLQVWLDATVDPDRFGRRPRTQAKHRRAPWYVTHWAWASAGALFVLYVIAGVWMLYGANYAIGDALARGASARSIVHSRDPHLMAVGFYWMPLPAFAQVPFMFVLSRLGFPALAMVLPTALATSLTVPILARIGRDLDIRDRVLVPFVLLFALNPYTIFSAASTMSEPWQVLSLAGCFAAYLRWTSTRRTRDVARLGLWLVVSQMSRTESLLVVLLFGALVAWQSRKGHRAATAAAVTAPALFALCIWTITSMVIIKHPWWAQSAGGAIDDTGLIKGSFISDQRTLSVVAGYSLRLTLLFGPGIAIAIALSGAGREIAGNLVDGDAGRARLRAVAIVGVGAIFPALQSYLLLGYRTFGDPRYFMPTIVVATLLSLVALEGAAQITGRAIVLLGCSVAGCFSTYHVLDDPQISHVTLEPVVIDSLHGRPWRVARTDLDDWRALTAQIDERLQPGDVLVLDQKVAPAIFLFSDHPTRIATERDEDTERELQLARPRYTWAVYAPGVPGVVNPAIGGMVTSARSDGMRWVRLNLSTGPHRTFQDMPEVWHLEPDRSAPTAVTPGPSAPDRAATSPALSSTTTTPTTSTTAPGSAAGPRRTTDQED